MASDKLSGAGLYSCGDSKEATFNNFKVLDMGLQGSYVYVLPCRRIRIVQSRLDSSSEVLDKGNVVLGQNDLKKLVDIKPSIWCIA